MDIKKIKILIACLLLFAVSSCYATTSVADNTLQVNTAYTAYSQASPVKDPNLIKTFQVPIISDKDYNAKLALDNKYYEKVKGRLTEEQFILYKIMDRLIRANNLQYQNWRIGVKRNAKEFNAVAYTSSGNLIELNSALYDTFYNNHDALAATVAHELAHLLLGHGQTSIENFNQIENYRRQMQRIIYYAYRQQNLGYINSVAGRDEPYLYNAASYTGYQGRLYALQKKIDALYEKERETESQADKEGLNLLIKAGYDGQRAMEDYAYLATLPQYYSNLSTHPEKHQREIDIKNELAITNVKRMTAQGRYNLYNSKPLEVKCSSDKQTIIITSEPTVARSVYQPYSTWVKYKERAYFAYLDRDYTSAIADFEKAFELYNKDYTIPLYMSFVYEAKYLADNNQKDLRLAKKWLRKAKKLNKQENAIWEQEETLKNYSKSVE